MFRQFPRAVPVFAIAAIATMLVAPTAQATGQGADTCPTGYVCGWEDNSYTGNHLTDADRINYYSTVTWDGATSGPSANDKLNSFASRFTRCLVRVYWDSNATGSYMQFSRPALGGQYQDPYFANGGPGSSLNWQDQVSSHRELSCV